MPWHVEKRSGSRPYKIVRSDTGEVVGSSVSRSAAVASLRARYANTPDVHAIPPRKKGFPG